MTVHDLKKAIIELTLQERLELLQWLVAYEEDDWDRQMAEDAKAGRLDFLFEEAEREAERGEAREWP